MVFEEKKKKVKYQVNIYVCITSATAINIGNSDQHHKYDDKELRGVFPVHRYHLTGKEKMIYTNFSNYVNNDLYR